MPSPIIMSRIQSGLQTRVAPQVLPMDYLQGAVCGYSLRKLRHAYAGAAVRVRRSSDSAEQDIGFVANEFDVNAFTTFIGGGSGFVRTWYDQSGSGFNANQTTAGAQPQIVLQSLSGHYRLDFDGTDDYLTITGSGLAILNNQPAFTLFAAVEYDSNNADAPIMAISRDIATSGRFFLSQGTTQRFVLGGRRLNADSLQTVESATLASATAYQETAQLNYAEAKARLWINGSLAGTSDSFQTAGNTQAADSAGVFIGAFPGIPQWLNGKIGELIGYRFVPSDADRISIASDQEAYFSDAVDFVL